MSGGGHRIRVVRTSGEEVLPQVDMVHDSRDRGLLMRAEGTLTVWDDGESVTLLAVDEATKSDGISIILPKTTVPLLIELLKKASQS